MAVADNNNCEISATKRILLVGREWNGKTSCVKAIANINTPDCEVIAIECNGVGETGKDLKVNIETVINNINRVIRNQDKNAGLNAIVFVMKYGVRFTKQEKEAVKVVKFIFGSDVFRKYGVILMTYGDLFYMDREEHGQTFAEWCRAQTGDMKKLFKEVKYRIVLFDNRTGDKHRQLEQFNTLFDTLSGVNVQFGIQQFEKAKSGREFLIQRETRVKSCGAVDTPEYVQIETALVRKHEPCTKYLLVLIWFIMLLILISCWIIFSKETFPSYVLTIVHMSTIVWIGLGVMLYRLVIVGFYISEPEERHQMKPVYRRYPTYWWLRVA